MAIASSTTIHNHPIEMTPEYLVEYYSDVYGVDSSLAKAIVTCESDWTRLAKNPNSSASGYFQFIDSTWLTTMRRMGLPESTSKTDEVLSIQAGVWLLATDGEIHWTESKPCWSKLWNQR